MRPIFLQPPEKLLSSDYYRRKSQLLRARILLMSIIFAGLLLLLSLSTAEGWVVQALIAPDSTTSQFFTTFIISAIFLFVYSLVLARMTLHICYHIENAKVAKTGVTTLFLSAYVVILIYFSNLQIVAPLAASKVFSILLFFLFWQSQLSTLRLQMHTKASPRVFIVSAHAFFVCRWVLIACWLILMLGFALALVSAHPIIRLEGWEGITLLGTFYLVFRVFVRNPHAHAID